MPAEVASHGCEAFVVGHLCQLKDDLSLAPCAVDINCVPLVAIGWGFDWSSLGMLPDPRPYAWSYDLCRLSLKFTSV